MRNPQFWCGAVLLAIGISGCDDDPSEDQNAAGAAGTGGSSGAAGAPDIGGSGGDEVTIPIEPPTSVELEVCESIPEGESNSTDDCFFCCTDAGHRNSGFFQGACACGQSPAGNDVCADQIADGDACTTCCQNESYRSASYSPAGQCICSAHEDADVCAMHASDGDCAVCCINAGYVGHTAFNGSCTCSQG
jgi:hypothetical protein